MSNAASGTADVKRRPPDRIVVQWCASCGNVFHAAKRHEGLPPSLRGVDPCTYPGCGGALAVVRYQLAARRGT